MASDAQVARWFGTGCLVLTFVAIGLACRPASQVRELMAFCAILYGIMAIGGFWVWWSDR